MRNRTENQIDLIMIRHGAAKSNMERRYLGKTDEPLTKDGISRLMEAKRAGYYPEVEYVFSGSMRRCMETAQILYPKTNPVIISEWEEIDFGEFEGKNYRDLKDDIRYQEWIDSGGTIPFPEGESREAFVHRCAVGLHKMIDMLPQMSEKSLSEGKTIGIIVHGGTIMSLLSRYGGGSYYTYQISNGEGYRCKLQYKTKAFSECICEKIKITEIEKL